MPLKRAAEAFESTEECILQYGKHNNIIKWREHMQTIVTELYGIVGMFITTDVRYELPRFSYRDYPADSSSESSSSEEDEEIVEGQPEPVPDPEAVAYAAARPAHIAARLARNERRRKASERLRTKFNEDDYIQRKRDLKTQRENERTMYPMMWKRMSLMSQSRVREEEKYKTAYLTLNCVLLWTLIRKTHLTHIFGDDTTLKTSRRVSTGHSGQARESTSSHSRIGSTNRW